MDPQNPVQQSNPTPPTPPPSQPPAQSSSNNDTAKNIIVILLLLFFFPLGVILMWLITKWHTWVKITITCLLLIIPVFAVLLATVLVSLNPAKQFSRANDTQRNSDVNAILSAINQVETDTGSLPKSLKTAPANVPIPIESGNPYAGTTFCQALVPNYIMTLPKDPQTGSFTDCTSFNTGYKISVSFVSDGLAVVTVSATPQLEPSISVTK